MHLGGPDAGFRGNVPGLLAAREAPGPDGFLLVAPCSRGALLVALGLAVLRVTRPFGRFGLVLALGVPLRLWPNRTRLAAVYSGPVRAAMATGW